MGVERGRRETVPAEGQVGGSVPELRARPGAAAAGHAARLRHQRLQAALQDLPGLGEYLTIGRIDSLVARSDLIAY